MKRHETTATIEQTNAWRSARPGDTLLVRLRSGNVQRFVVYDYRDGEPGKVYAQKYGQGANSALRRINAFEIVV